jgi:hypothetical protein
VCAVFLSQARDVFRVLFECADWMGCPDGDACKQRLVSEQGCQGGGGVQFQVTHVTTPPCQTHAPPSMLVCPVATLQAHHGLQHELEVFKSAEKGWGVRCWHSILQGSLVAIMHGVIIRYVPRCPLLACCLLGHTTAHCTPQGSNVDVQTALPINSCHLKAL